jgi:signal transduction histidine kinase
MNELILLPLVAFLSNTALAIYLLYRNPKSSLSRLYSIFSFTVAIWAMGDFMLLNSSNAGVALLWGSFGRIVSALLPALLLHFFLIFTKSRLASKKLWAISLYIPALIFIALGFSTTLITKTVEFTQWGYIIVPGSLYIPFTFYMITFVITGIIICFRFLMKTKIPKEKTQAKLIILSLLFPLVGGLATETISPAMGLTAFPLGSSLTTITVLIIGYAINKYRLMTPFAFSIQKKLATVFLLVILTIGITTLIIGGTITQNIVKEQIINHLNSVTNSKSESVKLFLNKNQQIATHLSNSSVLIDLLLTDSQSFLYKEAMEKAKDEMNSITNSYSDILKISIIDKNGIVIASTDDSEIDIEKEDIITALAIEGVYTKDAHISKGFNRPCMDYAYAFTHNGEVIGGLVIDLDLSFLNTLTGKTGVWETEDIYIINKDKIMITDSNFVSSYLLDQQVDTENSRDCMSMKNEPIEHMENQEITMFPDYRGVIVIGAYTYIPETEWCLLAEIDENEAFSSIYTMYNAFVSLIIIFAVLGVIFSVAISRTITKPIVKLKEAAEKIGKGELNTRIIAHSDDEVGKLAHSFRNMAKNLKTSQDKINRHSRELEHKVIQRTRELNRKIEELTKTKTAVLNMMEDMDKSNVDLMKTQGELKKTLTELKETDIKKNEFISIAAHELKTPLTSIHGFSQILMEEAIIKNREKRGKYLKIMDHETKRLTKLVDSILNLSRIDLGTININSEDIELKELIESIMREMNVPIKEKDLRSELHVEDLKINTDREKLTQILINLIINAVKYTEKGKITVNVFKDKEHAHFIIKDTGVGIERKEFEKIFDRFYQTDSSYTRKVGGTGLGLALCKEFVELLGGKIWVTSSVGKGSEFHFTTPLKGKSGKHVKKEEELAREKLIESEKKRVRVKKEFGE